MENKTEKNIEILIRARYPLVYTVSFEEMRVVDSIKKIAKRRNKNLFQWSITEGLETPEGSFLAEFKDPVKVLEYILQMDTNGIFVLKDFHHYMNDPVIIRKLCKRCCNTSRILQAHRTRYHRWRLQDQYIFPHSSLQSQAPQGILVQQAG